MISNTLPNIKKSKHACPSCEEHLLVTNDNFKTDDLMYHHCVNCGYDFFDDEQTRKMRERQDKNPGDDQPWNIGFILMAAMVAVVVILASSDRGTRREVETVNQVGLTYVGDQLSA